VRSEPREVRTPALAGVAYFVAVSFVALFGLGRLGPLDFWWWLGLNVLLAAGLSFGADTGYPARLAADLKSGFARKAGLGFVGAAILYAVFAAGRLAALKIFPFAASGIASIYGLRSQAGPARIALLLGLLVGPGEEIVWRGFLQEHLGRKIGRTMGLVLTAGAYALVHAGSGNIMLVLAAGVCGVFWGMTYRLFRSPLVNIVSHTVWAVSIFLVAPL
jgi:uncharacterized protein